MPFSSALALMLLLFGMAASVPLPAQRTTEAVTGLYGETIVVPCLYRVPPGESLGLLTWKKSNDDAPWKTLLEKRPDLTEADIYVPRVNISADSSLLISQGTLKDQGVYVCIVESTYSYEIYISSVAVYKKPALPVVNNQAEFLEDGVLTPLGTCVARDTHPAAKLTWQKNGQPLVSDGMHVVLTSTVVVDSSTGLCTTSSTLRYNATRQDVDARFSCLSCSDQLGTAECEPLTFPVHYLSLSPTGSIVKKAGEPLAVKMEVSPNDTKVSWTKDGERMESAPVLGNLSYADAGSYACEVSSVSLVHHRRSFDLVVEGSPVITSLTQNGSRLACVARGVPRPVFVWNVDAADNDESSYDERDGKATSKVTVVVPDGQNMSVTCSVSNRVGADARTIVAVPLGPPGGTSRAALATTCVLAVLLVLAAVAGTMATWIYLSSRRGSYTLPHPEITDGPYPHSEIPPGW